MKTTILKFMFILSSMFPLMKTPLSKGLILLPQTILITLFMNKIMDSSWFTLITFLMMIGGLLIIFSYMSSIASNMKLKTSNTMILLIFILVFVSEEMILDLQTQETSNLIKLKMTEQMSMNKIFNKKSMIMTMMTIMFLLFTMIVVTKMVKHFEGPLRSKN